MDNYGLYISRPNEAIQGQIRSDNSTMACVRVEMSNHDWPVKKNQSWEAQCCHYLYSVMEFMAEENYCISRASGQIWSSCFPTYIPFDEKVHLKLEVLQ